MKKADIHIGLKTGRLTVISDVFHIKNINQNVNFVTCRCDCGKEKNIKIYEIGLSTLSCGCWSKEQQLKSFFKHGMSKSKAYKNYFSMKQRCYNQKTTAYKDYGGRGITVCDRWLNKENGFKFFLSDMGEKPTPKHSIDRIDVNGNYEPTNCRWADSFTQANNKTTSINIEINGVTKTLKEWSDFYGVNYFMAMHRYYLGMPTQQIFNKEQMQGLMITKYGCTKTLSTWAKIFGVTRKSAYDRYYRGGNFERMFNLTPNNPNISRQLLPLN